jgi:hypothetical protein
VATFGVVIVSVAGCGSSSATPTQPPISDPIQIVTSSANRGSAANTVHVEGTLSGSVSISALGALGITGLSGFSGMVKLDGTSFSGDVDITGHAYHLSALDPALFGLAADVVQVEGYTYTRTSISGDKYTKSRATVDLPIASATFNIAGAFDQLKETLNAPGTTASLVGRDPVDGRDAYHVKVSVPVGTLNEQIAAAGGLAALGITLDSASLDYWAYVDSVQPAKLALKASSSALGSVYLTVTLTKYNEPLTIAAPPGSEVTAS